MSAQSLLRGLFIKNEKITFNVPFEDPVPYHQCPAFTEGMPQANSLS